MKVAVVGATGLVGSVMLRLLEERNFPVTELYPVASAKSAGGKISFKNEQFTLLSIDEAVEKAPDFALFSAGSSVSLEYAPLFAAKGSIVIDNSSAWRMAPGVPLVVPEINAHTIGLNKIIANPNCSTIQMVMVLKPLHAAYGIKRLVVSTYQSVTGTGVKAIRQLENERNGIKNGEMAYPHPIDLNCIPQCDVFTENGYTREEMKMVNETRKIMGDTSLRITATCVRIPVFGGHSESINIEFERTPDVAEIRRLLSETKGLQVTDDPEHCLYPMPSVSQGQDDVFVGRIRRDESRDNTVNLWIVSDNLRKGAATNALQIAEHILASR